jgi:hypothetical protein
MMKTMALLLGFALSTQAPPAQPPQPPQKIDIVSTMGCLKLEGTNNWTLVNATDPAPAKAGTPSPDQLPKEVVAGKNQFKLIGVAEFPLQEKKDKAVFVKGMYIKASPMSRLNITSVTKLADTCPAPK